MPKKPSKKAKIAELDNALLFLVGRCVATGIPLSDYRDWINYRLYQAQGVDYIRAAQKETKRTPDDEDADATRTMEEEKDELLDCFMDDPEPDEIVAAFNAGQDLDPDYETPLIQRTDLIQEMENALKSTAKEITKKTRKGRR